MAGDVPWVARHGERFLFYFYFTANCNGGYERGAYKGQGLSHGTERGYCGGRNLHRPTGEVMFSFVWFSFKCYFPSGIFKCYQYGIRGKQGGGASSAGCNVLS